MTETYFIFKVPWSLANTAVLFEHKGSVFTCPSGDETALSKQLSEPREAGAAVHKAF